MHAVSISNVSKHYRLGSASKENEIKVLDGVSLNVNKGEFIGILGPNGCGKTTLLKIILGLENPENGKVKIDGKEASEALTGYAPQHSSSALYPWFNCFQNIAFASKKPDNEKVLQKLKDFGLENYSQAFPHQLSGGFRQLVSIARATMFSDVLLLDEPLNALDYQNRLIVEKKLLGMRDGNDTVLMVSHDIESTVLLCDRIIVLSKKPSRIAAVIPVSLPKKRSHDACFTPEFQEIVKKVHSIVSEAVL